MNIPLQVTFHGIAHSDALEAAIRQRTEKLARFHPGITGCRAVVELTGRHKTRGRQYVVRIELKVPGMVIVVNRDHDEDALVAVREAFDTATRKLDEAFASP